MPFWDDPTNPTIVKVVSVSWILISYGIMRYYNNLPCAVLTPLFDSHPPSKALQDKTDRASFKATTSI